MKKTLMLTIITMLCCGFIFAKELVVEIKGDVFLKTEDNEMIKLESKDKITDKDTIIVGEDSSITFYNEDKKIVIRNNGIYKMSNIVK